MNHITTSSDRAEEIRQLTDGQASLEVEQQVCESKWAQARSACALAIVGH